MSTDRISKGPIWASSFSRTPPEHEPIKLVVPMPKFGTVRGTDFAKVDADNPTHLLKDVTERFPAVPPFSTEHPAFKVAIATLLQNPIANFTPADWAWHKEILRLARVKEEARRIVNRADFERYMHELHSEQEVQRTADKRAYFFAEAIKNGLEQTWLIKRGAEHAIENQRKMTERGLTIQDDNKRTAFLMLYLRHFAPNKKRFKRQTKEIMTTDSLTQIRAQEVFEKTPFELVVEHAQRMFPILSKEEVEALFSKWQSQLNSVRLFHDDVAAFKRAVTKLFAQVFMIGHSNGKFERDQTAVRSYQASASREFQMNKRIATLDLSRERTEAHVQALEDERAAHEHHVNQLNFNRLINNIYNERESEFRRHQAKINQPVPIAIDGITDWIQQDPIKTKTQYSLIRQWVNNVMMLVEQDYRNQAEVIDAARENAKIDREQINSASLKDAVEYNRVVDAMRVRQLQQEFTFEQITKMFAATAAAANMLTNYQTATPTHYEGVRSDDVGAVSKVPSAPVSAKLASGK